MKLKKLHQNILEIYYIPLALAFLVVMYYFRDNRNLQIQIVILSAIIYVSLALLHHRLDKSLTPKTMIEYILLGLLILILLQGQLI